MDYVLVGGTLIDGTGHDPVEEAAVHVQNGRIAWVGNLSDLPAGARKAEHKDASGKWILPGIIDAHIHVCWNGEESIFELLERSRDMIVLEATSIVKRILEVGTDHGLPAALVLVRDGNCEDQALDFDHYHRLD